MAAAEAFDTILVGAGSAGCVLAARLTEDRSRRVLLLEAGGPATAREIPIPAAFSKLFKSPCDWNYETEPQPHLHNRKLYWPRGKVLGGSSSINAQIYIRGHASDYDHWAALGNLGWAWADVLPCFLRAEDNQRGASEFHRTGGPLRVEDLRYTNPLSHVFLGVAAGMGFPLNPDFNAAEQEGFGFYQVTQRRGRRWSAADAYLKPALRRPNLTVRTGAHTTRVLFDGRRAAGVEYLREGRTEQARAGEVILAGGAVNSPQLLLLSGVGPAEHLRRAGIPVVHDLPGVGENLQDHLLVIVGYYATQPVTLDTAETFANLVRWLLLRRGPLASNIAEAGGFLRTRKGLPAPDLQFLFGPVIYLDHGFTRPPGRHGFGMTPCLLRPRSRGTIRLRSADPLAPPAIDPNYLAEEADLDLLVEGVKLCQEMLEAAGFDPYRGAPLRPETAPRDDAAWREFVRRTTETNYHPVGTCKMGSDELAVVDPELRVRGLDGLRVVDASVMPAIPGGNTNAPAIMIAERAAALLGRDRL